jgi:hypothetical protein
MSFVNFLLDLAAVVLWLSFRGVGGAPSRPAGTLLGNLRPVEPEQKRSWYALLGLAAILLLRPLFLSPIAGSVDATPSWSPGPVVLVFRSDSWMRLYLYSGVTFFWTWLIFFAHAVLLGVCIRGLSELKGLQDLVVSMVGPIGRWPWYVSLPIPMLLGAVGWFGMSRLFFELGVMPQSKADWHIALQCLSIGLSVWIPCRWVIAGVLLYRMLYGYVYLGEHPVWGFLDVVGRRLQTPISWIPLRLGQMDFGALLAAAIFWGGGEFARLGLIKLFRITLVG